MSYKKLRGKIKEVFGSQDEFAVAMGMNPATLSGKLNDRSGWTIKEAETACRLLDIPLEEVHLYFFTPIVA